MLTMGSAIMLNGVLKLTVCAYRPWIRNAAVCKLFSGCQYGNQSGQMYIRDIALSVPHELLLCIVPEGHGKSLGCVYRIHGDLLLLCGNSPVAVLLHREKKENGLFVRQFII